MHGLLVLKIGGSCLETGSLGPILAAVVKRGRPVIVVPGGGPFADQVRCAQAAHGFSDAVAHRLALLSMHQMAHVFAGLDANLVPAETAEDFAHLLAAGLTPVWMPEGMAAGAPDVPETWNMTSDGLAAWLAVQLGGAEVCLLKTCPVPAGATLATLANAEIVDPEFVAIVARAGLGWSVLGEGDTARLGALLSAPSPATGPGR
jgi:aspartokinase-like uncharacterized kinase